MNSFGTEVFNRGQIDLKKKHKVDLSAVSDQLVSAAFYSLMRLQSKGCSKRNNWFLIYIPTSL